MIPKRILLVDDEISFTRLLKLNLEKTNDYEVRVENWAEDALAAAREFRPDLILLDVVMPRMVGGDVAARLRSDDTLKATPIVFLSAAVSRQWVEEHDGIVGGFPFIAKPAPLGKVIACIEHQLMKSPLAKRSDGAVDRTPCASGEEEWSGLRRRAENPQEAAALAAH